jgi:uncharacterized alpha-E superfamily protein
LGSPVGTHKCEAERLLGELRARLEYARIDQIMGSGLHEYLDGLQVSLNDIGVTLERMFFHVST